MGHFRPVVSVGGANAHVIEFVESVQNRQIIPAPTTTTTKPLYLFPLSAPTEPTLLHWRDSLVKKYTGITDNLTLHSLSRQRLHGRARRWRAEGSIPR